MKKTDSRVLLFNLLVFGSRKSGLLNELESHFEHSTKLSYITTPNPEQVVLSREDKEFLQALKKADYLVPDGVGLVLASRIMALFGRSKPIKQQIKGVELVEDLLKLAGQQGLKIAVIGGRDYQDLASNTRVKKIKNQLEALDIHWLEAYQDVRQPTRDEESKLEKNLLQLKPDLVFVALGAPWQEKWVVNHWRLLEKSGVKLVMTVGGAFDFILGKVPRAPWLMRKLGLEWLFRLIKEPWRWRRQLRLVKFVGLVLGELFS